VTGEQLNDEGILIGFRELKFMLRQVLAHLEGQDLTTHPAWRGVITSTEALAAFIYRELERMLAADHVALAGVAVTETNDARAYYGPRWTHD